MLEFNHQVGGRKDDQEKTRTDLLPVDVLWSTARVLTDGAQRYGERNWENGMSWNRPYGALLRHLWAWWSGEDYDPDSGLPHLAHAQCMLMFLHGYWLRNSGEDNRPTERRETLAERLSKSPSTENPVAKLNPLCERCGYLNNHIIKDTEGYLICESCEKRLPKESKLETVLGFEEGLNINQKSKLGNLRISTWCSECEKPVLKPGSFVPFDPAGHPFCPECGKYLEFRILS